MGWGICTKRLFIRALDYTFQNSHKGNKRRITLPLKLPQKPWTFKSIFTITAFNGRIVRLFCNNCIQVLRTGRPCRIWLSPSKLWSNTKHFIQMFSTYLHKEIFAKLIHVYLDYGNVLSIYIAIGIPTMPCNINNPGIYCRKNILHIPYKWQQLQRSTLIWDTFLIIM